MGGAEYPSDPQRATLGSYPKSLSVKARQKRGARGKKRALARENLNSLLNVEVPPLEVLDRRHVLAYSIRDFPQVCRSDLPSSFAHSRADFVLV